MTARAQMERNSRANAAALLAEREDAQARRAFELRREGKSFWQIAEIMKLPEAQVAGMCHEAIRKASELVSNATKMDLLMLEVARLDEMQSYVWDDVRAGDTRAGDYVLRIIAQRIKAQGLDMLIESDSKQTAVVIHGDLYRDALLAIQQGRAG